MGVTCTDDTDYDTESVPTMGVIDDMDYDTESDDDSLHSSTLDERYKLYHMY